MRKPVGSPSRIVLGSLVIAMSVAACGGASDNRALIIVNVKVAADVPDFKTLTFNIPADSSAPSRSVDGPSHRADFQFGYYVSHPAGTITLAARAIRSDGCAVGEGHVSVSGVA